MLEQEATTVTVEPGPRNGFRHIASTVVRGSGNGDGVWVSTVHLHSGYETRVFPVPSGTDVVKDKKSGKLEFSPPLPRTSFRDHSASPHDLSKIMRTTEQDEATIIKFHTNTVNTAAEKLSA